MGLLDGFFGGPSDMPPEMRKYMLAQGLLGLGAGLLKAGGASRLPMDFGSALGAGLEQGVGAANASYGMRGQMMRNKLYDEQIKQLTQQREADEGFGKLWSGQVSETPPEQPGGITPPAGLTPENRPGPTPAAGFRQSLMDVSGRFTGKGWSPVAAATIAAGLGQESQFNPNAVGDNGTARGIGQWRGPRWAGLEVFARERGLDPMSKDTQLDYVDWELRNTERKGGDALAKAQDPQSALAAWNSAWRPAQWAVDKSAPTTLARIQGILGGQPALASGPQQQRPQQVAQAAPTTMTDMPQARNPNARMFNVTDEQWDAVGRLPAASRRAALMQLGKENRDRAFEMQKLNRVDTPEQEAQKLRIAQGRQTPDRTLVQVPDANSPTGFKYVLRSSIAPGTPAMGPGGTAMEFTDDGKVKSIQMGPGVRGGTNAGGMTQSNVTDINKQLMDATSTRAQLSEITSRYRPEYQEIPTRLGMEWAALKDKGAGWLGSVNQADQAKLREFSQYRASAAQNFTGILKSLSGLAVTEGEAKRAGAYIPNPGTGLFDGDSPTELKAKLDRFSEFTDKAIARLHYASSRGMSIDKVSLDDMPAIMNKRGAEIKQELMQRNSGAYIGSDADLESQVRVQLAREFGLVAR